VGLGQLRGPSWLTGTPRPYHRSITIVADGRFGVCDGARWAFVMKEAKGPALRFAIGGPPATDRRLPGSKTVVVSVMTTVTCKFCTV
jgi:hypothetical protein